MMRTNLKIACPGCGMLCALLVSGQAQQPAAPASTATASRNAQCSHPDAAAACDAAQLAAVRRLSLAIRSRSRTLANSPRLDQLIRDGKLYISLKRRHLAGA